MLCRGLPPTDQCLVFSLAPWSASILLSGLPLDTHPEAPAARTTEGQRPASLGWLTPQASLAPQSPAWAQQGLQQLGGRAPGNSCPPRRKACGPCSRWTRMDRRRPRRGELAAAVSYVWFPAIRRKRMTRNPYLTTYTSIDSKQIKDLHVRSETIKPLEETQGESFATSHLATISWLYRQKHMQHNPD